MDFEAFMVLKTDLKGIGHDRLSKFDFLAHTYMAFLAFFNRLSNPRGLEEFKAFSPTCNFARTYRGMSGTRLSIYNTSKMLVCANEDSFVIGFFR